MRREGGREGQEGEEEKEEEEETKKNENMRTGISMAEDEVACFGKLVCSLAISINCTTN